MIKLKNRIQLVFIVIVFTLVSCKSIVKKYYDNGNLMSEYQTARFDKEIRNGFYKTFNPDGTLVFEGNYRKDKLNGLNTWYYDNGNLHYRAKYNQDRLWNVLDYRDIEGNKLEFGQISRGEGKIFIYDEHGEIEAEGNVKNGLKYGTWFIYTRYNKIEEKYPSNFEHKNKIFL